MNSKNKLNIFTCYQLISLAAYNFVELLTIFPITPASPILAEMKSYSLKNKNNIFGNVPITHEYNSELGTIAGVHGGLINGLLSVTCSASQGLLLMIPNIYKCCGELLPLVIHVLTRSLAKRSLSIHGDHSDIYSLRQTGPIMISSTTPQELHYFTAIASMIAIEASYPVINFCDGDIAFTILNAKLLDSHFYTQAMKDEGFAKSLKRFREKRINPMKPTTVGQHAAYSTYFEELESQNIVIENIKKVIAKYLNYVNEYTDSNIQPFTYYGSKNAKYIIIAMGVINSTVKLLLDDIKSEDYGLITCYVYRPFLDKKLIKILESLENLEKIAVISKTKENNSPAEPLYVDVSTAIVKNNYNKKIDVINGRYGLSSKNTTPAHIKSVYDEMKRKDSKKDFTIGIEDDITFLSLSHDDTYITQAEEDKYKIIMFGVGGDGTVSGAIGVANVFNHHSSITKENIYLQVDKYHNSLKANNITQSIIQISNTNCNLFFVPKEYKIVVCSSDTLLARANCLNNIAHNGVFVLNTSFSEKDVAVILPNVYKKILAERNCTMYITDAGKIANKYGIKNKISMIMAKAALLKIDYAGIRGNELNESLKEFIKKRFQRYGDIVVKKNINCLEQVTKNIKEVIIKKRKWSSIKLLKRRPINLYGDLVSSVINLVYDDKNNVSTYVDSTTSLIATDNGVVSASGSCCSTSKNVENKNYTFWSKKKVNKQAPRWIPERCIQCNRCALVCPHATIRAVLLTEEEVKNAPQKFETLFGVGTEGFDFRIQVDAENCVGCGLCAEACPVNALEMVPSHEEYDKYTDLTNYLYKTIKVKKYDVNSNTIKGTTFKYPYLEASGACPGCGETPYYRILTQLFGKFMVIANATGCSSIYGGYIESPWAVDEDNCGPTWANSLYEDNAEFGLGMRLAEDYKIKNIFKTINNEYESLPTKFKKLIDEWKNTYYIKKTQEKQLILAKKLKESIKNSDNPRLKELLSFDDSFVRKSLWIIGGDGWSSDIDFGGIKHILSTGRNINVLILNTESFSNTGGQKSSASANIAYNIEEEINKYKIPRDDIATYFILKQKIYVAQVSLGMNPTQTIKAFEEAEAYNGPSVVICYCPCISHGYDLVKGNLNQREAVLSGYWNIFRYNPDLIEKNENPLILDFKNPNFELIPKFLFTQKRFTKEFVRNNEYFIKKTSNLMNYFSSNFEILKTISNIKIDPEKDFTKVISETFIKKQAK